jgi:hypothetical protein
MRKHVAVVGLILVFLAVFIPFASSYPDGLETVAAAIGIHSEGSFWNGLMADYSFKAVGDPYVSTFLAGTFGTLMVLLASFLLGTSISPKKDSTAND